MSDNDTTTSHKPATLLARGDQLMKNRAFAEAITLYEGHLSCFPTDLAAHMKLGICHLLNRGDNHFLKIFYTLKKQIAIAPDQPLEVNTLWDKYQGLVVKVTAGALVVGGLSLGGCSGQVNAMENGTNSSAAVVESEAATAEIVPPPQPQEDAPFTGHKYSGGIYFDTDYYPLHLPPIPDVPSMSEENPSTTKDQDEGGNGTTADKQK